MERLGLTGLIRELSTEVEIDEGLEGLLGIKGNKTASCANRLAVVFINQELMNEDKFST